MISTPKLAALPPLCGIALWGSVLWASAASPALAQMHDGIDNSSSQQRVADEFRAAGSRCDAPACRNTPDGIYPQSTTPGEGAKTPSISAGHTQD